MSDETSASEGGAETSVVTLGADAPSTFDSAESAVDALIAARGQANEPAESADDATADDESPDEGDAAQPEEAATGETQEDAPAKEPSRELPRSWSKDKAEAWAKLDPAVQDYLLEQDSKVSAEVRRAQNEAAEVRKTVEAEKKAIEVERERYLKAVSADLDTKEAEIANRFPHIKSMADVNFLANEAVRLANTGNPDDMTASQQVQAYLQAWRVAQDDWAVTKASKAEAEKRHTTEKQTKWGEFRSAESRAFHDSLPEAEQGKLKGYVEKAGEFLISRGFSQEQLVKLDSGDELLPLHDRRIQALIYDGMKYQELLKAPPKVVPKNLPPVQRPGTARPAGAERQASLQTLSEKLSSSGSEEDALELLLARRAASSRRAS